MLDANQRDILVNNVQSAQLAALYRALDAAWWKGYEAGRQAQNPDQEHKD
jgi:hypothetical protein